MADQRVHHVSVDEKTVYVARCHTCEWDLSREFSDLDMAMRWVRAHEELHDLAAENYRAPIAQSVGGDGSRITGEESNRT